MSNTRRRTRAVLGGGLALALAPAALLLSPAQALSNTSVSFTGTDATGSPLATCAHPSPSYSYAYTPSSNDAGSGRDYAAYVLVDGNDTLQDQVVFSTPTSTTAHTGVTSLDAGTEHPFGARPLSIVLYDLDGPVTSSTGDGFYAQIKAHGHVVAADTIDPAGIPGDGVCASRPFVRTSPQVALTRTPAKVTRKTRETLVMTVAAPARKQPTGSVVFKVTNGKRRFHHHRVPRVLTYTVPLSGSSASITLPRLLKGGHAYSATYTGNTYTAPAAQPGGFRVVRR